MIRKSKPIEVLVKASLSGLGEVKHEVSTTKELKSWVVELKVNGKVNQSQRVFHAEDVKLATKIILRTEHLLGNYSAYTRAATQGSGDGRTKERSRPVMA